ncbi:cytochrome P450 78A7-like [Salvia divinorum]|uniref:Cytochrome P450 78A7-like n=1 Tax=Salvia divinorum TaxID=28513 RepID=A0ABD1IBA8_SALDI
MSLSMAPKDSSWWVFTLPAFLGSKILVDQYFILTTLSIFLSLALLSYLLSPGGAAWKNNRTRLGRVAIPGPRGIPFLGSLLSLSRHSLAHRTLSALASSHPSRRLLMAFSLGRTPAVVSSHPQTAKEILTSPHMSDRPIKHSARCLMFSRAIGFAPNGPYWRLLRRVAASHLFSPRRIAAHEPGRRSDSASMMAGISLDQSLSGAVSVRKHLQKAALNNITGSVFGRRYEGAEAAELEEMVREGFELLGAFNWSDYVPWMTFFYDPRRISARCGALVPRVRKFVAGIIDEHRVNKRENVSYSDDFVDVLLSLDGDEKLDDDDMIAVLWEMIFRGTDTTALLTEWILAELILHPEIQSKLRREIDDLVAAKEGELTDADVAGLPYLQGVVKETLRVHPPGPLLSWARLSTSDVHLSSGMVVPAGTTAMVNMWAIAHDPAVWEDPLEFRPSRFVAAMGGADVDVRGGDLRLAPFGAGRRVCPGKNLGMATVAMWVAKLVRRFEWAEDAASPVDLSETLKLSCEMKFPLSAVVMERNVLC